MTMWNLSSSEGRNIGEAGTFTATNLSSWRYEGWEIIKESASEYRECIQVLHDRFLWLIWRRDIVMENSSEKPEKQVLQEEAGKFGWVSGNFYGRDKWLWRWKNSSWWLGQLKEPQKIVDRYLNAMN